MKKTETNSEIDAMVKGFVNSMFLYNPKSDDVQLQVDDFTFKKGELNKIRAEVEKFYILAKQFLDKAVELDLFNNVWEQAGYDFYHTICRYGVGFWESEWEPFSQQLTEICRQFNSCHAEVYYNKINIYFI